MKSVFEECVLAFRAAAQDYIKRRARVTGENAADLSDDVAKAMIGCGCIIVCKTRSLGPDRAIDETKKCLRSLTGDDAGDVPLADG
jgi:predicted house-cleaning NTP pyrophosphatase (Maf/HAM1 superfamily)